MMTVILLTWTISNCCPTVQAFRSQGYSDEQIEQLARANKVPEWVIAYAKRKCSAAH